MKDKGLGPFRCILRFHIDQMYLRLELTFPPPVLLGDKSSKTEFICTFALGKGRGCLYRQGRGAHIQIVLETCYEPERRG